MSIAKRECRGNDRPEIFRCSPQNLRFVEKRELSTTFLTRCPYSPGVLVADLVRVFLAGNVNRNVRIVR